MSTASSRKSKEYLEKLGVIVKVNTMVKEYDGKQVWLQDGSFISSTFVIWVAGVTGNIPPGIPGNVITKLNQIKTDIYNHVTSLDGIFAIGDIANIEIEAYPKGFPQLANVAIDQARNLANNFKRIANGKTILPFHYVNKGAMATVGRNKAVVDLARPALSFQGFWAWITWMTLHLFLLIGFKNRLIVFINWMYKYFTHSQSLALLFKPLSKRNEQR
jgi:NADH dehydrogenase